MTPDVDSLSCLVVEDILSKYPSSEQVNIEPLMLGKSWYKQAVVDTNIKPGTVKAINFRWESGYALDFSEEGQFRLRIIKQPGDEPFPLSITIEQPADYLMYNTNFDLTNDRTLHYNTQLSEDVDLMFNW